MGSVHDRGGCWDLGRTHSALHTAITVGHDEGVHILGPHPNSTGISPHLPIATSNQLKENSHG